jgi:ELWxxDGT repeat protein
MSFRINGLARLVLAVALALSGGWAQAGPPAYRVRDINPGPGGSEPVNLTDVDGTLFFVAADGELWKSDGTELGTVQVKDIRPGGLGSWPSGLVDFNGTLFFSADDGSSGIELWRSDGTPGGTVMVKDIHPGPAASYASYLTVLDDTLLFGADDGVHGRELWKTDGTLGGTLMVKDINPDAAPSFPFSLTLVGGVVFFSADDGTTGHEPWTSDGTTSGTMLLRDIRSGPDPSNPKWPFAAGGFLAVFFADDGVHGEEPWRTDGTFFGTQMVKDINPVAANGSAVQWPVAVGATLFFVAHDGSSGRELWRSDGTSQGTVLFDLYGGPTSSNPYSLTGVGGRLFFGASSPSHAGSLWVSDGTPQGTVELYDSILAYGPTVDVLSIADVYGRVFFAAGGASDGELWTSNGALYGTYPVQDIQAGAGDAQPAALRASGGLLYFVADDGTSGRELWATDLIFDDGFERPGFTGFDAWSGVTNDCPELCDLEVLSGGESGLDGIFFLNASVNDTNPLFVLDDTPRAEGEYRARFLLDPSAYDPGEASGAHRTRVFIAFSDVPVRRQLTLVLIRNSGVYRILLRTRRDDGTRADLPAVTIAAAPHAVEVDWTRSTAPGANDGTARLWIDGILAGTLSGLDNDGAAVDFVRLGAMNVKSGANGTLRYDRFQSRRRWYIGP